MKFPLSLFVLTILFVIIGSIYRTPSSPGSPGSQGSPGTEIILSLAERYEENKDEDSFHEDVVDKCNICTEFSNPNVYVAKSKYKGRGVFASHHISMGEEIEVCPILLEKKNRIPHNNVVTDYVFSTGVEGEVALALGYCGLINHDDKYNARWIIDRETRKVTIVALTDISKGQEIFVSYGDKYWETRNLKKDEDTYEDDAMP